MRPAGPSHAAAATFLARLQRPSTILVAISGGSDSTGLLLALRSANVDRRHRLVACTVDHALREGSAAEAAGVAALCAALDIPHLTSRWSHDRPSAGVQARARDARYGLLLQAAHALAADLIVTGHTADDQAETVAMRGARSRDAAAPGLAGMADCVLLQASLWACRPFLGLSRQAVRDDLAACGQGWIDDPSNTDPRFERIRLRLDAEGPPPSGPHAATRRAASADAVARCLSDHVRVHVGLVAEVAASGLVRQDPQFRRALAVLAATLGGRTHAMGRDTADRLFAVLAGGLPGARTASRVVFERRGDRLFLYRESRDLPQATALAPGTTRIWDARFVLTNPGPDAVVVRPGGDARLVETLVAGGIPEGVARRAARAAPSLADDMPTSRLGVFPLIAPYDTFLPRFDLMIAQSIAALLGRAPYPLCPVDDISTN